MVQPPPLLVCNCKPSIEFKGDELTTSPVPLATANSCVEGATAGQLHDRRMPTAQEGAAAATASV
jgi:hypothetical protein